MLYLEDTESDPECDGMLSHTLPSFNVICNCSHSEWEEFHAIFIILITINLVDV